VSAYGCGRRAWTRVGFVLWCAVLAVAGMRSRTAVRGRRRESRPARKVTADKRFRSSKPMWWAWLDLNQQPHPYQGSALGLVSPGWLLRPGRTMYRWRPLRTARLRWHVDQTWTRHAHSRGQRRSAWRTLPGKVDPRRLPPTSEPRHGNRLVRGSPGGVWARDIPCIDGLSLVTGMVVPQLPACSNHAHYGGWLGPHGTSRLMRAIRPFEHQPSVMGRRLNLRFPP
jgi:hypothetical protein